MSLTEKNIREKIFHNNLQSKPKGRFENIFYKALYNLTDDFFIKLKTFSKNAKILDYGCGTGSSLKKVIEFNQKKIVGIDISDVSIEKARINIGDHKDNLELMVDNCEQTKFNENEFDLVYGTGFLHHLQINQCLNEISRVLKPGGRLLFIEPLGTNPFINLYRYLTPNSRSKDEHPLLKEDFDNIKRKFSKMEVKYYGFFTLIFFPFYKNPKDSKIFKALKDLDQYFFKFRVFRKLAWSVLIIAEKT